MAIRIRSTEKYNHHPMWQRFISEFPIADIQGVIFSCTDGELIEATKAGTRSLTIQCLEAAEYDNDEELMPEKFFPESLWKNKVKASTFFNSSLLFLTYKKMDSVLFRLHEVNVENGTVLFKEIKQFANEYTFITWWKSIKKLAQSKPTVEARSRQDETIFDKIIEKNGSSWGGNIDGLLIFDDNTVKAIIEVRKSGTFEIEKYDPANFFSGTAKKGGDFKTWLPLIYLKKAFKIPIVLLTFSTVSGSKFGYTEVSSIDNSRLYYAGNIPPTKNITDNFDQFKKWLLPLISK